MRSGSKRPLQYATAKSFQDVRLPPAGSMLSSSCCLLSLESANDADRSPLALPLPFARASIRSWNGVAKWSTVLERTGVGPRRALFPGSAGGTASRGLAILFGLRGLSRSMVAIVGLGGGDMGSLWCLGWIGMAAGRWGGADWAGRMKLGDPPAAPSGVPGVVVGVSGLLGAALSSVGVAPASEGRVTCVAFGSVCRRRRKAAPHGGDGSGGSK